MRITCYLFLCVSLSAAASEDNLDSIMGAWKTSPPVSNGKASSPQHWGSEGAGNDNERCAQFPTPNNLPYRVYDVCIGNGTRADHSPYNLSRPPSSKESNYLLCYLDFLDILHLVSTDDCLWDTDDSLLWDAVSCRYSSLRLWSMALLYTKDRHNLVAIDKIAQLERHPATSRLMREELAFIVNQEDKYLSVIKKGIPPSPQFTHYQQRISPSGLIHFNKKFEAKLWQQSREGLPVTIKKDEIPATSLKDVKFLRVLTHQIFHLLTQGSTFELDDKAFHQRSQPENFLILYADFLDLFNTPEGDPISEDSFLWQALSSDDAALRELSVILLMLKDRKNIELIFVLSQYVNDKQKGQHIKRYLRDVISSPSRHIVPVLACISHLEHPQFKKYKQLLSRHVIPGASYQRYFN